MNGYIPDFIITFSGGEEILVEVKGMMDIWKKEDACKQYMDKIQKSGWEKLFMIIGCNVDYDQHSKWVKIGLLGEHITEEELILNNRTDITAGFNFVDNIMLRMSNDEDEDYINWSLGGFNGNYDLGLTNPLNARWKDYWNDITHKKFKHIWSTAKNSVQWKGKQNINNAGYLQYEKINNKMNKLEETIEQLKIEIRFLKHDKYANKKERKSFFSKI